MTERSACAKGNCRGGPRPLARSPAGEIRAPFCTVTLLLSDSSPVPTLQQINPGHGGRDVIQVHGGVHGWVGLPEESERATCGQNKEAARSQPRSTCAASLFNHVCVTRHQRSQASPGVSKGSGARVCRDRARGVRRACLYREKRTVNRQFFF